MQYLDGYRSQSNGPTLSITKISIACSTSSRRPIAENYISWAESAARTKRTERNGPNKINLDRSFMGASSTKETIPPLTHLMLTYARRALSSVAKPKRTLSSCFAVWDWPGDGMMWFCFRRRRGVLLVCVTSRNPMRNAVRIHA